MDTGTTKIIVALKACWLIKIRMDSHILSETTYIYFRLPISHSFNMHVKYLISTNVHNALTFFPIQQFAFLVDPQSEKRKMVHKC